MSRVSGLSLEPVADRAELASHRYRVEWSELGGWTGRVTARLASREELQTLYSTIHGYQWTMHGVSCATEVLSDFHTDAELGVAPQPRASPRERRRREADDGEI